MGEPGLRRPAAVAAAPLAPQISRSGRAPVVAVVGMDGCGKTSTWRAVLEALAVDFGVAGVGDAVVVGAPGRPLAERRDFPLGGSARLIGGVAKGMRWLRLYKNLKFVELTERAWICDHIAADRDVAIVLTDGHPLVNTAAWSAARYFRDELASDAAMMELIGYLTGRSRIPPRRIPAILVHSWQLVVLAQLPLARYAPPERICLLDLAPEEAMRRIRARGRPLQPHETPAILGEVGRSYARVCALLGEHLGVPVATIRVDEMPFAQVVELVAREARDALASPAPPGDARASRTRGTIGGRSWQSTSIPSM